MHRRARLVFLALSLTVLIIIGRSLTRSFSFLLDDFWFTSGLLLLILLSTVEQPFFTSDSNVFMNGLTGALSLLLVSSAERTYLWYVFLVWCVYLVASSYIVMFLRTRELKEETRPLAFISRLNRQIGRPEALFSALFLWGVITQFTPQSTAYRGLLTFWAVFLILNLRGVSDAISQAISSRNDRQIAFKGVIRSFSSPRVFECEIAPTTPPLAPGANAKLCFPGGPQLASCVVIDDRVLGGIRLVRIAVTSHYGAWPKLAQMRSTSSSPIVEITPQDTELDSVLPAGVVSPGSTIQNLHLSVNPDTDLVEGEVLAVDLPNQRAYYQVVSATLQQKRVDESQSLQEVEVVAGQLGIWRDRRCRFEPVTWVAPAGGLVLRLKTLEGLTTQIPPGHFGIGKVPNSEFPVHLDLDDVVTHNTAVIGVTGSGKSYLALWLIKGLVNYGVRVLVLDVSRQHWIFLREFEPSAIKCTDDIPTWLAGGSPIAVHQYANSTNYPRTTAEIVRAAFSKLEGDIKLKAGENEPARLCIVFEEAHSLIPEWNQVAQRGDEQHVNRTARTVLQGRKYGIGCIVISQRTANVTKTILNQCNTIIALQSFDQTGLNFLSNYMGSAYANAICTLPPQHAVLVGKASSSTRPVLFGIRDLSEEWGSASNSDVVSAAE